MQLKKYHNKDLLEVSSTFCFDWNATGKKRTANEFVTDRIVKVKVLSIQSKVTQTSDLVPLTLTQAPIWLCWVRLSLSLRECNWIFILCCGLLAVPWVDTTAVACILCLCCVGGWGRGRFYWQTTREVQYILSCFAQGRWLQRRFALSVVLSVPGESYLWSQRFRNHVRCAADGSSPSPSRQPTPILFSIQLHLDPSFVCTYLRGTSASIASTTDCRPSLRVPQSYHFVFIICTRRNSQCPWDFIASASTANSCEVGVIIILPPHSVLSTASTQWR